MRGESCNCRGYYYGMPDMFCQVKQGNLCFSQSNRFERNAQALCVGLSRCVAWAELSHLPDPTHCTVDEMLQKCFGALHFICVYINISRSIGTDVDSSGG